MVKLHTPLSRANLRKHTSLRAKLDNETRWTSVYKMIERHVSWRDFVHKLEDKDLDDVFLAAAAERPIDALLKNLKNVNGVVLK